MQSAPDPRTPAAVRLLEGPNLFFPRPAGVITLDIGALLDLSDAPLRRTLGLTGVAGSDLRGRSVRRLLRTLVRRLTHAAGYQRVAVRVRPGPEPRVAVVAVPWASSGSIDALGQVLDSALERLAGGTCTVDDIVADCCATIRGAEPGRTPQPLRLSIPTVAVTGTNGKTTTCRVVSHIARRGGRTVGLTSTAGVFVNGAEIVAGDYSGPAGARLAAGQGGVDLLVAETARGGILRRGIALAEVDVAVVTNVTPDHLGLDGVHTIDQLSEVKAVVARLAHRRGWTVLNADDPRTLAMRHRARARVWVFTTDPDSPGARAVLDEGGRVTTLYDGMITVLGDGAPRTIVALADLTWTFCGRSSANVENALAAGTAALALGLSDDVVAQGLATFDLTDSPRRFNVYSLDGRTVVLDMAHNEAGLAALLEVGDALRGEGCLLLAVGTGADRGPEVHARMGEMGALAADVIAIKHAPGFLEGHTFEEVGGWMRAGIVRAGKQDVGEFQEECAALESLFSRSGPGDLILLSAHEGFDAVDSRIRELGGTVDDAATLRRKLGAG